MERWIGGMISEERLAYLEEVEQAATPGPWILGEVRDFLVKSHGDSCRYVACDPQTLLYRTPRKHWHQILARSLDPEPFHTISTANPHCVQTKHTFIAGAFAYDPGGVAEEADAQFIVVARTAIPELLAEIRRLQAEGS